jgi:hypothetical protein
VQVQILASAFSYHFTFQAAKGAPNNSPTEPYNPAAYQSSMPSQFGTAFVPHHSQASMQPIGDTDRTRQILEVPPFCARLHLFEAEFLQHCRPRTRSISFINFSFQFNVCFSGLPSRVGFGTKVILFRFHIISINHFSSSLERLLLVERDARREEQVFHISF